jgi:hypothetical protein
MQRRTQATFERWWGQLLPGAVVHSYAPLQPWLRVTPGGSALEYVPESVALQPPGCAMAGDSGALQRQQQQQQQQQQQARAEAGPGAGHSAAADASADATPAAQQGVWGVERFLSLLLGEIPRLRDDADGYGPKGSNFIGHVDIPGDVEAAWAHLARRYPHLHRPSA